jgi:cell division protein FtsB
VRIEVYLARESKISRLLELEADVEKLSRTNSRLIAQIQRLERERNEIAQKLSKVRISRSAREQTTIYWIPTP